MIHHDVLRMTLIALVSIIGSFMAMIGVILAGALGIDKPGAYILLVNGLLLDVLLDCSCIALSLKFSRKQYDFICNGCDGMLKRCCIMLTNKITRKTEMELAASVQRDAIELPTASSAGQVSSSGVSMTSIVREKDASTSVTKSATVPRTCELS